jgi:phage tail-like protein
MSLQSARGFHFGNAEQWRACRFLQADSAAAREGRVRPVAPLARPGALQESAGAHAPVIADNTDVMWTDDQGQIHRDTGCSDRPLIEAPPGPIARAKRLVATRDSVWAIDGTLVGRYDAGSWTRVLTVESAGAEIRDIASDGLDAVLVLFKRDGQWYCTRVSNSGRKGQAMHLAGLSHVAGFVYLRRARRLVVLAGRPAQLYWYAENGSRALFGIPVAAQRPCFSATAIASDGRDRVFVAGSDGEPFGGATSVLIFDADGNALGDVPIDRSYGAVNGIAAARDRMVVATGKGLLTFRPAETIPDDVSSAQCTVITPVLRSPEQPDGRRWLRIEATADLPDGTTLELSHASTASEEIRDRIEALLNSEGVPESRRVEALRSEPDFWQPAVEFHGSGSSSEFTSPFSAKLFDLHDPYVWVKVTIHAAPGARIPTLSKLSVLYPGRTLMENLPALYQAEEERPDSFLRGLVGVLETTTQTLDARIGSMGSRIHPSTAPEAWLNFIARWLGLPWDDGMTIAQKRAIVGRARELAQNRGTRAGLEALLWALMPDPPQPGAFRFRVTDATADFGFAIVAGSACEGARLPAMLAGSTRSNAELGSRSVLGDMRLPCRGARDDGGVGALAGRVRVEVAATRVEREQWRTWFERVIAEMLPLTARLDLRWVNPGALADDRLGDNLTLQSTPAPHLGSGALTGIARLPPRGVRLSSSGPGLSTTLR